MGLLLEARSWTMNNIVYLQDYINAPSINNVCARHIADAVSSGDRCDVPDTDIIMCYGDLWVRDCVAESLLGVKRYYRQVYFSDKQWWQFWRSDFIYTGVSRYGDVL